MNLRLIAYGIAALALAGLLFAAHHVWVKAERLDVVEREYKDYKAGQAKLQAEAARQLKVAQEASNAYQTDLRRLESERSDVPVVRLCKSKPATLPTTGTAASGPDAAGAGHFGEAAETDTGPDIGAQLLDYGIACEANALQLTRLQEWVRRR